MISFYEHTKRVNKLIVDMTQTRFVRCSTNNNVFADEHSQFSIRDIYASSARLQLKVDMAGSVS